MVDAISSTQGTSPTYQTKLATMQQMLIQQMFQSADTNGDGTLSKTEFENFYNQFTGANSTPGSSTTAAADQLYQQLNTTGAGLTQGQFASAVKQMMSEKTEGNHRHHGTRAGGTAGSTGSTQTPASSASKNPTTWLETILTSTNHSATGQSASSQSNGGIEFIA